MIRFCNFLCCLFFYFKARERQRHIYTHRAGRELSFAGSGIRRDEDPKFQLDKKNKIFEIFRTVTIVNNNVLSNSKFLRVNAKCL